jgi:tRNA threonylcarbamoyl adenosine modification protein YeaZ
MHSYIAIQSTYDVFEMALFINDKVIEKLHEDKRHTSKLFIPLLEQLLSKNKIAFAELSFCAVNCGPAPFSTLRSIIASVNGLHCATNIPLVGIDGLDAIFVEFYDKSYEHTVVLLNAFNNESYYLIAHHDKTISTGYKKTELLRDDIQQQFPADTLNIIDNKICSIETIGRLSYEKFIAHGPIPGYLMPLHLKKHPVEL